MEALRWSGDMNFTVRQMEMDKINPPHYKSGEIEFIEYARSSMSKERFEGGLEFNVKKYMHRWSIKNGVEDLKKAEWYLKRLIKNSSKDEGDEIHKQT